MPLHKHNIKVSLPSGGLDPNAPANVAPTALGKFAVTWSIAGDLSAVRGFNVALSPSNSTPYDAGARVHQLEDSSVRSYTFIDIPAGTYTAWVQAYVDGADSEWVASTGVTIADDQVPTIRNGDDRNIAGYAEDMNAGSLPTGFSLTNASHVMSGTEMVATNAAFGGQLTWTLNSWISAFLDPTSRKNGTVAAMVKLKVDVAAGVTDDATFGCILQDGTEVLSSFPLVNDGKFHLYRVPLGNIFTTQAPFAVLRMVMNLPAGAVWRVDAIALVFQNVDSQLDGRLDRALNARNQFGTDPTGGGFFLQSPIKIGDTLGNYTVVESNGLFYLRDDSGSLVTETPFKLARKGRLSGIASHAQVSFNVDDSAATPNWGVRPKIPFPVAHNKMRMLFEDLGNSVIQVAPATYPVRRWVDAVNIQLSGFSILAYTFEGGTYGRYTVEGPWTRSSEAKSSLTPGTRSGVTTDGVNHAWYHVQNDAGLESAANDHYLRIVPWLKVVMPNLRKANGRPYYVDLLFTVWLGTGVPNTVDNRLDLTSAFAPGTGYNARVYTDGRTHRFPIVRSMISLSGSILSNSDILVNWHGTSIEGAGAAPTSVEIEKIEWDYIWNPTIAASSANLGLGYNYLEEF